MEKTWKELSNAQKALFLEEQLNKHILPNVSLLALYIKNLKKVGKNSSEETIKLMQEGFSDRLLVLIDKAKALSNTITEK